MPIDSQPTPRVLAETPDWIVIYKPSGWLSIPGRAAEERSGGVVLDWVRSRFSEAMTVHRLDLETSGVMLFARGPEAHRKASLWFQNREMRKHYLCLALGRAARPLLKIQKPIEGAACMTQVEVLERFSQAFYARVRPLTGRRHQIRIHLAGEGYPLLGDVRYGGPVLVAGSSRPFGRVALHAESLELPSGERFVAPLAEDFTSWLEAFHGE